MKYLLFLALLTGGCIAYPRVTPFVADGPSGDTSPTGYIPPDQMPMADTGCAFGVHDAAAPVLFFSDLESGPGTGGSDDLGAFVTIYGLRFGTARNASRVFIGGKEVANYVAWNPADEAGKRSARKLERLIVQPGPNAVSGDIVVQVAGLASNPLPFTLRAGRIFLVDSTAASSGDGSFAAPFASLFDARSIAEPGDIVYVKGTFTGLDPSTAVTDHKSNFLITTSQANTGTDAAPIAYIGYPGAAPSLGGAGAGKSDRGIRIDGSGVSNYVFANWIFHDTVTALLLTGKGHRVIGNHIKTSTDAVTSGGRQDALQVKGNLFDALAGGVVLFTDINGANLGWNEATGGSLAGGYSNLHDHIAIHDNLIVSEAYNAVSLKDNNREALIYNNIIANATYGLSLEWSDSPATQRVVAHNTLWNVSYVGLSTSGPADRLVFRSNIFEARKLYGYFSPSQSAAISGDGNLYYQGAGTAVVPDMPPLEQMPLLKDPLLGDFTLRPGSPARAAGSPTAFCADYYGVVRPATAPDIGAIQSSAP